MQCFLHQQTPQLSQGSPRFQSTLTIMRAPFQAAHMREMIAIVRMLIILNLHLMNHSGIVSNGFISSAT